jgi:RNA polymerase sigma-70 factor, ECF subfamily
VDLLPEAETLGLLALMLFQESRRATRVSLDGEIVLLEEQDRSLWDKKLIEEGRGLIERALATRCVGPYTLQAAIAAVHAQAKEAISTDWGQIVGLYDVLLRANPSPVIELNRAVAVAMRDGPATGLALIDQILERGDLQDYYLAHSARADLRQRLHLTPGAVTSYKRALSLAWPEPARRFLERRLRELENRATYKTKTE